MNIDVLKCALKSKCEYTAVKSMKRHKSSTFSLKLLPINKLKTNKLIDELEYLLSLVYLR